MRKIAKSAVLFAVALFTSAVLQGQTRTIVRHDTICPGETGFHSYMDTLFFEDFESGNNSCWQKGQGDRVKGFDFANEMCWWADPTQCKQPYGGNGISAFAPDVESAYSVYDSVYEDLYNMFYTYLWFMAYQINADYELSEEEFYADRFKSNSIYGRAGGTSITEWILDDAAGEGYTDIIPYLQYYSRALWDEPDYTYTGPAYMTMTNWLQTNYLTMLISPKLQIYDPAQTKISFYYINDEGTVTDIITDEYGNIIDFNESTVHDEVGLYYRNAAQSAIDVVWSVNCEGCPDGYPEEWTKIELDLPSIATADNNGDLIFSSVSEGATGLGIDNVLVYGPRHITIPAEVSALNGGQTLETQQSVQRYGCATTIIKTIWYVRPSNDSTDRQTACATYTWPVNGQTYTADNNTASKSAKDQYGCDSTITLDLTIHKKSDTTVNVNTCNSYTWEANDETYTTSGSHTATLTNQAGCDSTITLNLTISESVENITRPKNVCNSYYWDVTDQTYTTDTNISITETDANGCETTKTLELTVNYASEPTTTPATACDSYTWEGETYEASTTESKTLKNNANCDSVVTLELVVNHASQPVTLEVEGCETYTWELNNNTYDTEGQYTDTIENTVGCDSIITISLTLKDAISVELSVDSCDRYYWEATDSIYRESTTATVSGTSSNGCDSTTTLAITIGHSSPDTHIDTSACDSYSWQGMSLTFDTSAVKDTLLTNQEGCDSLVTLSVTIYSSATTLLEDEGCESYHWSTTDKDYTADTTVSVTLATVHDCDSTVTLTLAIRSSINNVEEVDSCDRYYWEATDSIYTLSTSDTVHGTSQQGCDSNTILLLTIGHASVGDTAYDTVCDSYTWHLDADSILTLSGFYHDTMTNAAGCDSSVFLQLVIKHSSTGSLDSATACDSFYWSATDTTYRQSGNYGATVTNAEGCDSSYTLRLTLNSSSPNTVQNVSVCSEYYWAQTDSTYTLSGDYGDTLRNVYDCDSVIVLSLVSISGAGLGMSADTTIAICGSATLRASGAQLYIWQDDNLTLSERLTIAETSTPTAAPMATTCYQVTGYFIGDNLVANGDFTEGNTGFTSDLAYNALLPSHGTYAVNNNARGINTTYMGREHTAPARNDGRFMIIDGATSANVTVWSETVEVQPNTEYLFSMWGTPIVTNSSTAELQVYVNGTMMGDQFTLATTANNQGNWSSHYFVWNSGSATSATLRITNRNYSGVGNLYGIDDISFVQLICSVDDSVTVHVHVDTTSTPTCDAYTWSETGITYTETGIYSHHIATASGCDSLQVLDLTVLPTTIDTMHMTTCSRYLWALDSHMYDESGIYTWSTRHTDGTCDTIHRLKLTILDCGDMPVPDNIVETSCGAIPSEYSWDLYYTDKDPDGNCFEAKHSSSGVNSVSTPMIGDVDGDGITEIISCAWSGDPSKGNQLLVFDGKTGTRKYTINTATYSTSGQLMSLADMDGDGKAELFLLADDGYLYCYSALGMGQKWRSRNPIDQRYLVMTADVNADGVPEVVCGPYIFDAQTGTLLLHGTLETTGQGYGAPAGTTGYGKAYYMQGLADIDFDGQLEFCAGNTIYKPSISNPSGWTGNSWSVMRQADSIEGVHLYDGQTFLADFDGDGDIDVCVIGYAPDSMTVEIYVWEGQSSSIIAHRTLTGFDNPDAASHSPSLPTCADVTGSGTPDIIFSYLSLLYIVSYDADSAGNMAIQTDNASTPASGVTTFDFDQDGVDEIIVRGNNELTVISKTPYDAEKTIRPTVVSNAELLTEYAVVADVDGDGHADIIVNQDGNSSQASANGKTVVYTAYSLSNTYNYPRQAKVQSNLWASARRVWNQWAYAPLQVNEDLTIPQRSLDKATIYPNGKEPYNSFLRQMSLMDKNGDAYTIAPDINTTNGEADIDYFSDGAVMTLMYCNDGSDNICEPYHIHTYLDDADLSIYDTILNDTIYAGKCAKHQIRIPLNALCSETGDSLHIYINNERGISNYELRIKEIAQRECDTTNNSFVLPFQNYKPKTDTTFVAVCDRYYWAKRDTLLTATTDIADTVSDNFGCDSISWLSLTIHASFYDTIDTMGCDLYLWHVTDEIFHADTSIVMTYTTVHGCDSIYSLTLEMHESYDSVEEAEACDGYFWEVNNRTYTYSGLMSDSAKTLFGCDSVHNLYLTIYPTLHDTVYDTICHGTTRKFGNQLLGETGHYIYTLSRDNVCDSIHELYLHVIPSLPISLKWSAQCQQLQYTLVAYNPNGYTLRTPPTWEAFPADPEVTAQNGHDTIYVHPTLSTIYTATITYEDSMACPTSVSLTLEPPHEVKAKIGLSTSCLTPDLLDFRATAMGEDFSMQDWTIDGEYYSDQKSILYHFEQMDEFDSVTISLRVSNGYCADSQTVVIPYLIAEINAPNIFSTSDDRFKYFKVRGKGIIEYEIYIYNRQGLQVFHSNQLGDYWDGTHKGTKVPQGAYVYYITYRTVIAPNEVKHLTGTVVLVK